MSSDATGDLLKVCMAQSASSPSSVVNVASLRRSSCPSRAWQYLTRRKAAEVGSWQHRLLSVFASWWFSVIVSGLTFLALFLEDIAVLASEDKQVDERVAIVIFICFVFFLAEISGCILVQDGYFLSFFFACDLIGTLRSVHS